MELQFSGNVRNECRNSHAKFGGAARHRFYAMWKKPQGGGYPPPPPSVHGLTYDLNVRENGICKTSNISIKLKDIPIDDY